MRISMREFVPGRWSVPQNPITGGIGDFVPGMFVVPENPVMRGSKPGVGDFVAGKFAVPQNPVADANQMAVGRLASVNAGMGDITPTAPMYPISLNSVLAAYRSQGLAGLGCGGGSDCSCGGSCGGCGMGNVSSDLTTLTTDISAGNLGKAFGSDSIFGVPVWVYAASVVVLGVAVFSGGEEHSRYGRARRAYKAARSAYQ